METQSIIDKKKALRSRIKELRESTADSQAEESRHIAESIAQLPMWQDVDTVLLYCSLNGEVDTTPLLEIASGKQPGSCCKRVVLPVVEGDLLILREYSPERLSVGYKGIMEPSPDCAEVDPSEIQLALIPGVAFDPRHHRLGRGKGFYDRLLPLLRCPVIGLGFSWQMIDAVPVEAHDVPLSGVITPQGLF